MSSYIFHIYILVYSCGFVPLIKGLLIFQVKFNFSPINNNGSKKKTTEEDFKTSWHFDEDNKSFMF